MKVILLQELHGRGGEGDVVDVAHGFAVNYLLPRKLAVEATPGNLKQLEQRKKNIATREETRVGDAEKLAELLEGKKVKVTALVGEEGQLFGSVTSPMIREALLEQLGVEVDHRRIETRGAIKTAGEHEVMLSIYREIKAAFTVHVAGEEADVIGEEDIPADDAIVEVVEEVPSEGDSADEAAAEEAGASEDSAPADEAAGEPAAEAAPEDK